MLLFFWILCWAFKLKFIDISENKKTKGRKFFQNPKIIQVKALILAYLNFLEIILGDNHFMAF